LIEQPTLHLVNVNFPRAPHGFRWTRQSVRLYDGKVVAGQDPMGRRHYWVTVRPLEGTDRDSDRWAVDNGYVSMTPLRLDLTDGQALDAMCEQGPLQHDLDAAVERARQRHDRPAGGPH
jgi:5'-nucleotidase